MTKQITILLSLVLISHVLTAQPKKPKFLYQDALQPIELRIDDLLEKMTLEEKVMQLNQYTLGRNDNANNMADPINTIPAEIGSLIYFSSNAELRNRVQRKAMEQSRLGIPIIFGYDVIHGFKTIYPISLAQACSWNPDLVQQAAAVAAQESRMSGVDWTFSPMIDVARDGRWGRVAEGYGEDPYTNSVFAVASVKGYQGKNLANPVNVAACLKHYVGYGASEAGRDYVYTEISDQTLWDTYLPPYEAAVKAGAATLMSSFNDISGTPGTANTYLLRTVLKEQWKHDGFVVSDWGAIEQLRSQGVAKDKKEAASKAFNAGVEMDMMNQSYDKHLATLVKEGKVTQAVLDDAVKRVLRIKFRLGLFEKPYTPEIAEKKRFLLPESRAVAARLAQESIVLLKNEHSTLPLAALKNVAVIGPMSNSKWHLLGSWRAHGNAEDASTIYENIKQEFGSKTMVTNAQGCDFDGTDQSGFAEANRLAKNADAVVICLGEKANWSGENASRSTISLPAIQEELLTELKKSGKPVILLLSSGRPLDLSRLEPLCDAILSMWQPGTTGGKAVAEVLSGKINPSGKLAMTFPYSSGQIPIYYNHRQSARPNQGKYQDITSKPLYDFGHGLSYTTFEYAELKTSSRNIKTNGSAMVEVAVKNTGNRDGMETVHWFISDPVSSISRPVKELKFFQKQFIRKGETKVFRFLIDPKRDLGFVNARGEKFVEEGDYYIIVKDQKIKIELLRE